MPGFSHFLGNRSSNFRMFECLVTCFLRVTVSLLCRLQAVSKIHVPIYPCLLISKGRRNCTTFDRHSKFSNGTATVRKHVNQIFAACENLCWYFSENLPIVALKLIELTQFALPNLSIYFNFVWCWGVRCDIDIFKITAHAQSINNESLFTVPC